MAQISRKQKKGFSLLEVIIAIFIVTVGITGAVNLMSYSIASVAVGKSKIIASHLSQEGLEIVRNIRDSNWLRQRVNSSLNWNDGLRAGDWRVQYNSVSLMPLTDNPVLKINNSGFYQYDSGSDTPFRRKITITDISTDEIKVVSEVSWNQRGRSFSVSAEVRLFNWK